jgi:type I restriction enzyme M protein
MEKLTSDWINGEVWKAADVLRGSIDSSDYKTYIFGFLFLKKVCDSFEEKKNKLKEENKDFEDKDNYSLYIPEDCSWKKIKKLSSNIGNELNKICQKIEDENENSNIEGLLTNINFNDLKLGEDETRNNNLRNLINIFSKIDLSIEKLEKEDTLGKVYEFLIKKFADDAGKKGGEFYTPTKVVKLIINILNPKEDMKIYDPTCGSGGMLIESFEYLKKHKLNEKNISLYGQESNLSTWAICKMNMIFHNILDSNIEKGDTLRNPKHLEKGALKKFDIVVANPPFSLDKWGQEDLIDTEKFGRFEKDKMPPKSKADFAFILHMIKSLENSGRLGVVVPHGVLFRGGTEGKIRKDIIRRDLVECVIGLPENLFYGTSIPAAILILNKQKIKNRENKILFIDSSNFFDKVKSQNELREEDIEKITKTYKNFKEIEKYSRIIEFEELEENEFNLNISRYVDTTEEEEEIDIQKELNELKNISKEKNEIEKQMNKYLEELGFR